MIQTTVLLVIGFTATVAQILVLRELLVVYYGNEVSLGVTLANWIIWIAFGSGVLGRIVLKVKRPESTLATLQIIAAITLPATIVSIRVIRSCTDAVQGEILSPGTMIVSSFLVLAFFCSVSGAMFPAGSRLYSLRGKVSTAEGTSSVYLLEAAGSGIGGLLASLVLIRNLSGLELAFLLALVNLACAAALLYPTLSRHPYIWSFFAVSSLLAASYALPLLESKSLQTLWGGLKIVENRNSAYGNLTVVENEESRTLYVNSLVAFTSHDLEAAEESVHFALLQHSSPASLLLIGGGLNGSLEQALQHRSLERIDYVELDPEMYDLARTSFGDRYSALKKDPRIRFHKADGRLFLRTSSTTYDVIIVNLPDPKTAQLNRFYTLEFFREGARKLTRNGLISFQVSGAENYISDELAAFLGCLHRTLKREFPNVIVFPGSRVHFFAAKRAGALSSDPGILMERLRSRGIQTQYVREYYLPFRLMPDRLEDLESQLIVQKDSRINRDFTPVAYYFDLMFWSTHFHRSYLRAIRLMNSFRFSEALATVLAASLLLSFLPLVKPDKLLNQRWAACCSVWAMGFTMLSLEILLLFGFQAVYGYVYHRLSLILAAFMAGMALGSWLSLHNLRGKRAPFDDSMQMSRLFWLQLTALISPFLLSGLLVAFTRIAANTPAFLVSVFVFPLLALLSGLLGGYHFPIVSRLYFPKGREDQPNPGLVYGCDLLGAWCASLLLTIFFFPVYGLFASASLIAAVNAGPLLLAKIVARRHA